ncbi:Dyp-type peroxidase [Panus rudis PR-1116 ss-1]|nr:Dyp-type peroxidase [Panus rudis PR-1116 ss-1]
MSGNVDLKNIQGDIWPGIPKKFETHVFFNIADAQKFKLALALLVPFVTTGQDVTGHRQKILEVKQTAAAVGQPAPLVPLSTLTIAFSQFALNKLGIKDNIGDAVYQAGQKADAQNLGDKGTTGTTGFLPAWDAPFLQPIDGLIIVAGDSQLSIDAKLVQAKLTLGFGLITKEVFSITGNVRPGDEKGHEHFGFLDGISNPAINNLDTSPLPGQESIRQGFLFLGREGDDTTRPSWAIDGSILAFRFLGQHVPEFNKFLEDNPIPEVVDRKKGSEFLGARLVGRWKSGAPLDLAPTEDDPDLGKDPQRNNDFKYTFPGDFDTQDRCPFGAHVRKTNPRNDLEQLGVSLEKFKILRRGIPYGPEVGKDEEAEHKTKKDRGLLFRCYQSHLVNGFQFLQKSWANTPTFPPKNGVTPGFDPIIGQTNDTKNRSITGTDPNNQTATLALIDEWVLSKGGEYFFVPSIPALKSTFAAHL